MVTDPAISPISGSMPSSHAVPTPMTFCMTNMPTTQAVNSSRATPPRASIRASAPKPILAKKASISAGCSEVSKLIRTPPTWVKAMSNAATKPPTTGSGIEYFCRNATRSIALRPITRTSAAMANVAGTPNCQFTNELPKENGRRPGEYAIVHRARIDRLGRRVLQQRLDYRLDLALEPGLTPRILPTNYRRGGACAKSRSMPCSPLTTRASRS